MPDDTPDEGWSGDEPEADPTSSVPHDDIMKRLLDYQRSLREGASPEEAAEVITGRAEATPAETVTATADLLDLEEPAVAIAPEPEHEQEPEPQPSAEVAQVELAGSEPAEPSAAEPGPAEATLVTILEPSAGREGAPPTAPSGAEPPRSASRVEVEARLAKLEGSLDRLGSKLAALRQSFQEMAVAADERLATLEDELAEARGEQPQESHEGE
jgi:hypothetical protein